MVELEQSQDLRMSIFYLVACGCYSKSFKAAILRLVTVSGKELPWMVIGLL
jgi:hypothetical protein